jgi:hypothetical protein
MSQDIMATNREAILHWLDRYQEELFTIRKALELGGQPTMDLFTSTQLDRESFMLNPPFRRRPEGAEPPSSRDAIGQLLVGGLYDKLKEANARVMSSTRKDDPELRRKLGMSDDRDDQ